MFLMLKKLLRSQQGTTMVLMALSLTALVGILALVADVGLMFLTRTELARAADAAALAGAGKVLEGQGAATQEAEKYLAANNVEVSQADIKVDTANKKVNVTVGKKIAYFFAPIFGSQESIVSAAATAQNGSINGVRGVAPIGIEEQPLVYGSRYTLKWSSDLMQMETPLGPGNFGVLNFTGGGGGASDYREFAARGYSQLLRVGDVVAAETGNMSGPTLQGFNERVIACSSLVPCTWENYEPDCPRIVVIPVYQVLDGSGANQQYKIVGFAAFWLEEVAGHGGNSYVNGYFIKKYLPGEIGAAQEDYGLRAVKLVD